MKQKKKVRDASLYKKKFSEKELGELAKMMEKALQQRSGDITPGDGVAAYHR